MRKRARGKVVFGGVLLLFILTGGSLFLWKELRYESRALQEAMKLMEEMKPADAGAILEKAETQPLYRVRYALDMPNPLLPFLRGSALSYLGKYSEAQDQFAYAVEACNKALVNFQFTKEKCLEIKAEAYVRAGDASFASWQSRSYDRAISLYREGLLLRPDDIKTKKILEWLLVAKENLEKADKNTQNMRPGRGKGLTDLFGSRPSFEGKGNQERRGY